MTVKNIKKNNCLYFCDMFWPIWLAIIR